VRALVCDGPERVALREVATPEPGPGEVLVRVAAALTCATDFKLLRRGHPKIPFPLTLGHEFAGRIERAGAGSPFDVGDRVTSAVSGPCGNCEACRAGRENLCAHARFTGYHVPGGYAEFTVADERFCFPLPDGFDDAAAAPLLCAGLIGWRALAAAGDAQRLGLYGFGAAAHIVAQVARHQGRRVFAFTKPGDAAGQAFARELGAEWAGGSDAPPPEELDAAIIFAPVGALLPAALRAVARGGAVVCAGIHMSEIPAMPYSILWGERVVRSVANLTRRDGEEFLRIAPDAGVRTAVERFPLSSANEALARLRAGTLRGAAVLVPEPEAA